MHAIVKQLLIVAGLGACALARADGLLLQCTDANGHIEYTNMSRKGNCRVLDVPGAIAAPPPRPGPAHAAPRAGAPSPAASPAEFPKVDSAEQKARDLDRRRILQDELKSEEGKLAELKKEFNGGEPERHGDERNYAKYQERVAHMKDNINRAEQNVEALKREIANIR
jgi:hypothetical protein